MRRVTSPFALALPNFSYFNLIVIETFVHVWPQSTNRFWPNHDYLAAISSLCSNRMGSYQGSCVNDTKWHLRPYGFRYPLHLSLNELFIPQIYLAFGRVLANRMYNKIPPAFQRVVHLTYSMHECFSGIYSYLHVTNVRWFCLHSVYFFDCVMK